MYQQLTLNIKREEEISEEDLWDFDNFNWLKGNPANLRIFFTEAMPRLNKMMVRYPKDRERLRRLKEDCYRRLRINK